MIVIERSVPPKHYTLDMRKGAPLSPNLDRFDFILRLQELDYDRRFISKILEDSLFEESNDIWDVGTICDYLSRTEGKKVEINDSQVQSILESFIQFMTTLNLKSGESRGTSVRFLESLVKACKATALLMGHSEVTVQDAFDVILFVYLAGGRDATVVNASLVNRKVYEQEICSLIKNIENCIG